MFVFSIVYFFAVTMSTGMLIDLLVVNWQAGLFEKMVMRFGVGLAAMSVVGIILNLLQLPLDYRVFLAVGIAVAVSAVARNGRIFIPFGKEPFAASRADFYRNKSFWYALIMLILFGVTVKMHIGGAFAYDYLEDTDPWGYTAVADYIGENRTFSAPYYSVQYGEPYTQGYQLVMGVISQTNDSIYRTMKYFSALVASFGVLFMYCFARRFSNDEDTALLAGLFLFAVPAWVTHFVFSLHYNMTLFIVLAYVLAQLMPTKREPGRLPVDVPSGEEESFGEDSGAPTGRSSAAGSGSARRGWMVIGIVVYASLLVNHLSTVLHGTIFCLVLIVTRILAERKIDWKTVMVFSGGFLLSQVYFIPAYVNHWWLTTTNQLLGGMKKFFPLMRFAAQPIGIMTIVILTVLTVFVYRSRTKWQRPLEAWLDAGHHGMVLWLSGLALVLVVLLQPHQISHTLGTADRFYQIGDFFSARAENMINNPVGLGPVIMTAVMVSFLLAVLRMRTLFQPENSWIAVSFAWTIAAFLLVLGKYFSFAVIPFRVWTFLGLFTGLFAAWGVVALVRSFSRDRRVLYGVMVLLAVVTIPTSFVPKLKLNTQMVWKDTTIGTPQSRRLFSWMRDGGIPKNSVVAHLCGNSEFLSGYDMNPPLWDKAFHPERDVGNPYFVDHPLHLTPEAYAILKNAGVEYVTVGASCLWQAPGPPDQEFDYGTLIRNVMDGLMADRRLELINKTDLEILLKLK